MIVYVKIKIVREVGGSKAKISKHFRWRNNTTVLHRQTPCTTLEILSNYISRVGQWDFAPALRSRCKNNGESVWTDVGLHSLVICLQRPNNLKHPVKQKGRKDKLAQMTQILKPSNWQWLFKSESEQWRLERPFTASELVNTVIRTRLECDSKKLGPI